MCDKIRLACVSAPFTTTMTTIDARSFVSTQACKVNMFAGCNKSVDLLLNPNVLIVASVPQFTPQLPHRIDGRIASIAAGGSGAMITACGPSSPAAAIWTAAAAQCKFFIGGVAQFVPQFPNGGTGMKFNYQHGKFPGNTTAGQAMYYCLICGGGEGTSDGEGWNHDSGGEEIDGLAIDLGGNASTFGYYTMTEAERSITQEYRFGGYAPAITLSISGNGTTRTATCSSGCLAFLPNSYIFVTSTVTADNGPQIVTASTDTSVKWSGTSVTNASGTGTAYEAGLFYDRTEAVNSQPGPARNNLKHGNMASGIPSGANNPQADGVDYEGSNIVVQVGGAGCTSPINAWVTGVSQSTKEVTSVAVDPNNNGGGTCTGSGPICNIIGAPNAFPATYPTGYIVGTCTITFASGSVQAVNPGTTAGYIPSWITGGPMIDDVNCASTLGSIGDCVFVDGVQRADVKNVHAFNLTGYSVNYGPLQRTNGGEISLIDANSAAAGILELGAGIDNAQQVSGLTPTSSTATIVNDLRNGVTLTTANYPDGLGTYLPANFITGLNGVACATGVPCGSSYSAQPTILYNTASASVAANIATVTMSNGMTGTRIYRLSWYVDQSTTGGGCGTSTTSFSLQFMYQDPNSGSATTKTIAVSFTGNGAAGTLLASGNLTFPALNSVSGSAPITYNTISYTSATCTTKPQYQVYPLLELVN
jgi:hypothetical protein